MRQNVGKRHSTHYPLTTPTKHRKRRNWKKPLLEHDTAKDSVVPVQGGAVPAMVAELVLTLIHSRGTSRHGAHDVWVTLVQLPLPAHQPRDIVTDHTGP